jgi:competence protein ComEA
MRRVARLLLLALCLAPSLARHLPARGSRRCAEEGRGTPPRTWLGCAADAGTPRDLTGDERFLLGRPLDPNRASARELAFVPGLTPRLAAAVVAERSRGGPFRSVGDLLRVHGIGPGRLARAGAHLSVAGATDAVAAEGE